MVDGQTFNAHGEEACGIAAGVLDADDPTHANLVSMWRTGHVICARCLGCHVPTGSVDIGYHFSGVFRRRFCQLGMDAG
jgi:hypothetical protein